MKSLSDKLAKIGVDINELINSMTPASLAGTCKADPKATNKDNASAGSASKIVDIYGRRN